MKVSQNVPRKTKYFLKNVLLYLSKLKNNTRQTHIFIFQTCDEKYLLPVHPEQDDGAAAVSVVAGEAGCGGKGPVHNLQELLLGSEALDPPALMAD